VLVLVALLLLSVSAIGSHQDNRAMMAVITPSGAVMRRHSAASPNDDGPCQIQWKPSVNGGPTVDRRRSSQSWKCGLALKYGHFHGIFESSTFSVSKRPETVKGIQFQGSAVSSVCLQNVRFWPSQFCIVFRGFRHVSMTDSWNWGRNEAKNKDMILENSCCSIWEMWMDAAGFVSYARDGVLLHKTSVAEAKVKFPLTLTAALNTNYSSPADQSALWNFKPIEDTSTTTTTTTTTRHIQWNPMALAKSTGFGIQSTGTGSTWGRSYGVSTSATFSIERMPDIAKGIEFKFKPEGEAMVGLSCGDYSAMELIYKTGSCFFNIYMHLYGEGYAKAPGFAFNHKPDHPVFQKLDWSRDIWELRMNSRGDIEYVRNGAVFWTVFIGNLPFPFHAHVDFAFSGGVEYIKPIA